MKPDSIVAGMWESFAAKVMPPTTPEVQYTEMRRAFYAGCYGMLTEAQRIGEPDVSEDEGVRRLESMHQELLAFYADLMAGKC